MGHGFEDPSKRNRKRAVDHSDAVAKPPSAKRTAIAPEDNGPEHQERVRASVRALFDSYIALCNRSGTSVDSGAFQAMLKAAQGDIASQRLAARLVPRFIALFPDQVEVAAAALIKLYERYQHLEDFDKPLEEHTRKDALQGLQAVLLAASSNTPHGCQAVKLILSVLFKLLPQPDNEALTTEEPEEEEGEVAHHDSNAAAAAHGPWVRKVLRQALQQHPVTTLTFCFGCLGTSGRNSSSSSSSSAVVPATVQGVRLWLRDHILREASPSREGTPMDCDGAAAAAAAAAGCASAAAAAAGGGVGNGMQVPKAAAVVAAAAAAGGGAAGAHPRGCALQAVLESSAELRAWVRKESKGISRAPEDAKAVLQAAMQLMPPERAPSSKRPLGNQQQQQQQQRPGPPGSQAAGPSRLQQQQPPQFQQPSQQQQQQQQQHKAPNGVVSRPVNGMEALGRSWSTPSPGRGSRGRTASGRPPDPAAAGSLWAQLPHPAGPICRLEPCVLLSNLPRHITKADLQQQLQAVEAWILDQQPPAAAAGAKSPGLRACCVMKAPLDAARAYMRHHKANRFGPQQPPVQVFFADGMPSCSRTATAAAAGGGSAAGGPSLFLWALRAVAGDAEKVTDDLREAGLVPKSVSRVNHGSEPGTVLEAHSAKEAADMLAFLLKAHPGAAAAQQQQPSQEELPPLPPEPPPGTDWAPGSSNSSRGGSKLPSTPAGPAAGVRQQQQQATPPVGGTPSQQQQQQGFGPGFRRSNSMPVGGSGSTGISGQSKAAGEGGWRNSPAGAAAAQQGGWTPQGQQQQVQQPWAPGSMSQQQQPWQQGASPGQLGPGMDAGAAAGRPGWQHGTSPHHAQQQQQQGRWPPSLTHPSAAAGGPPGAAAGAAALPPFPGPPGSQQQQQLQRQHSLAGASPSGVGGGTPNHGGSPAGPAPSLAAGQGGGQQGTGGPTQQQYAGAQVLWRGGLYKSEVPVGTVCCVEPAGGARQSGAAPEPHQWPEALHINHRISVNDALEHYASAAPHARAVRLLLPQESPAGNVQAIRNFVQYLTTKGRAGMVKLPGAKGACGRALYLIVPRAQVCQSLQIAWDGRCVMLIVVIVPQSGTGGGGSSGGGAAGGKAALPGPPGSHGVQQQHMGHRPMR